ncbi:heterokaryon incompatibility domain-containing protein [Trichoderma sp. TUCIM 5745]
MENATRFRYQQLPKDNDETRSIRLLHLRPGSPGEPVNCSIVHQNLCDKPDFEALSYCWGDAANPLRIYVGRHYIDVTQNLHDALLKLRDKKKTKTLWIDAICINQDDLAERSQQVTIMKQIYQEARKTVVWLGPENGDTARAFELIPYLMAVFRDAFQGMPRPISNDFHVLRHPAILRVYQQLQLFEAFVQLEQRPYFSRVWIIQELVVSQNKVVLFWGEHSVSWEEYLIATWTFACFKIQKPNRGKPLGNFLHLIGPVIEMAVSNITLISLLDRYRQQESTDPRDKVFALLGIADSQDVSSLGCKVDYNMTAMEVYIALAKSYIQRDGNFDILGYVKHGANVAGLPSWVPDWTNQGEMAINLRTLVMYGISFNHHSGGDKDCGASVLSGLLGEPWGNNCCNAHVLETIAGLAEKNDYIAGGTALDALFITQFAGSPKPVYDKLQRRLHEVWEEAKSHPSQKGIRGSVTISTVEGQKEKKINLRPVDVRETGETEALLTASLKYALKRRFATTRKGYFALVPEKSAVGDTIAILKGGNYPFVLRARGQSWSLVGECYVHGVMNGEAFDESACESLAIV